MTKRLKGNESMSLWRLEPHKSYSDWKVEIATLDDDDSLEIYHVNKAFLAAGPRKSSYFQGLFDSDMNEAQNNTTQLSLQKSAVEAFPFFLDYMYTGDLKVSTENAVALRHLGDYFGVEPLEELAKEFIQKDSTVEQVCHYCKEALLYNDPEILDSSMKRVALVAPDVLKSYSLKKTNDEASHPVHGLMSLLSAEQMSQLYSYALEKALADKERFRIPYKIVVKNAGHPAVNGVYKRDGMFKGDVKYSRPGEYDGDSVTFSIFKVNLSFWYLSIAADGKKAGTAADFDFYSVPVTNDCIDLPPLGRYRWITKKHGRVPPPELTFLERQTDTN